jgi:hypothetical protein
MAIISTITIGSVVHSVYAETADPVQDALDYLAAKIGSTFSTATELQQQQALISAARMLDRSVEFTGEETVAGQPRAWPRDNASNNCTGEDVTDGTVPDDIAFAEYELADILWLDADVAASSGTGSNVKRVKAGSAEVEFFTGTEGTLSETRLPTVVNDLAGCYVENSGISGGSWGTSDAEGVVGYDPDDFDLSQGLP